MFCKYCDFILPFKSHDICQSANNKECICSIFVAEAFCNRKTVILKLDRQVAFASELFFLVIQHLMV